MGSPLTTLYCPFLPPFRARRGVAQKVPPLPSPPPPLLLLRRVQRPTLSDSLNFSPPSTLLFHLSLFWCSVFVFGNSGKHHRYLLLFFCFKLLSFVFFRSSLFLPNITRFTLLWYLVFNIANSTKHHNRLLFLFLHSFSFFLLSALLLRSFFLLLQDLPFFV